MELLTYTERRGVWVAFPSVLHGLWMSRFSSSEILLFSTDPVAEIRDLVAFTRLFKASGRKTDSLGVASPYPSWDWIRALRTEGITKVLLSAELEGSCIREVSPEDLDEVPWDICHALHARAFDGYLFSVCGNRFDRLVLGRRQFAERCFTRWTECPWFISARLAAAAGSPREDVCI